MEINVQECSPKNARKKLRDPDNWKINKEKVQR